MHLYIETRTETKPFLYEGPWVALSAPENAFFAAHGYVTETPYEWHVERNYELFATLAGVRNKYAITPLFAGRGLPGDIADPTKLLANDSDIHSQTWCTLTGAEVNAASIGQASPNFAAFITALRYTVGAIEVNPIRLVFGFDN